MQRRSKREQSLVRNHAGAGMIDDSNRPWRQSVCAARCVLLGFGLMLALAGCNTMTPPTTVHQPMTARPAPHQDSMMNQGSIYQPETARLSLYEDRRAFFVGDTITIVIEEKTSASKKSSGNASRN